MRRGRYIGKRVFWAVITMWVAVTINFVLFRQLPGNIVTKLARVPDATPQLRAALAREFGLDHSTWHQYWSYLWQLVHGNLGVSYQNAQPVIDNLRLQLGNTLPMVALGTVVSILLGLATGVIAAWRRGTWSEHVSVAPALGFYATPVQWLGLMLIIVFESVLPTSGRVDEFLISPSFFQHQLDILKHMALPALTLGLVLYGQYTLIARSAMLETLGEDYVLTARAVGYSDTRILRKYALRNALLPVTSVIALSIGFIVGGAILVETVFNWPGIGLGIYQSLLQRDYPMLQGAFLLLTISVVLCNLIADLLYFKLDPRIT
ncbi:MAG TPA: ABC transporter permease [Solirubrobacteraceae bacterium]|nr:ABC transporter permease [Solirubrobacteraceae bacterium]